MAFPESVLKRNLSGARRAWPPFKGGGLLRLSRSGRRRAQPLPGASWGLRTGVGWRVMPGHSCLFCGAGTLTAVKSLQLEMVLKVIGASMSPRAEQVDVLLPVVCKNAEVVHTPGAQ